MGTAQLCFSPPQPTWTVFLARSQVNTEGSAHSKQRQINQYFLNTECLQTLTETFTYMISFGSHNTPVKHILFI